MTDASNATVTTIEHGEPSPLPENNWLSLGWGRRSALGLPASMKAAVVAGIRKPVLARNQYPGNAIGSLPGVAPVGLLDGVGRPSTVFRAIRAIIVASINSQLRRIAVLSSPSGEGRVILPLRTHGDPPSAVVGKLRMGGPLASTAHSTPDVVQPCSPLAVPEVSADDTFARQAPTGVGVARLKVSRPGRDLAAAIAGAHPREERHGRPFSRSQYRQPTVPAPGQVFKWAAPWHALYYHGSGGGPGHST